MIETNDIREHEISVRRKRFFAFVLSVIMAFLPTVDVIADVLEFYNNPPQTISPGDSLKWTHDDVRAGTWQCTTGRLIVFYQDADGNQIGGPDQDQSNPSSTVVIGNCGITELDRWSLASYECEDLPPTDPSNPGKMLTIRYKIPSGGKKSESKEELDEGPAYHDPNAIDAKYIKNGMRNDNYVLGRQEQSPLGTLAFRQSLPEGWTEGVSMSMSYMGKNEYSLKDGRLIMYIPKEFQKAGRRYALMAIDKNGNVVIINDTDVYPTLFTADLNVEGYAFELIYKD